MSDPLGVLTRALHEEQSDIDVLAKMVAGNSEAVKLVIDGLTFPVETYRYNCNRVIVRVAETTPGDVYPTGITWWSSWAAPIPTIAARRSTYCPT